MSERCCCFESVLLNELVDTVHKTDLNNWFVNQTDPVLKFITQWLKDPVLVLNSSLKEEDKNNLCLITTVNNDLNFCLFITQNYCMTLNIAAFFFFFIRGQWTVVFLKNNTAINDSFLGELTFKMIFLYFHYLCFLFLYS